MLEISVNTITFSSVSDEESNFGVYAKVFNGVISKRKIVIRIIVKNLLKCFFIYILRMKFEIINCEFNIAYMNYVGQ